MIVLRGVLWAVVLGSPLAAQYGPTVPTQFGNLSCGMRSIVPSKVQTWCWSNHEVICPPVQLAANGSVITPVQPCTYGAAVPWFLVHNSILQLAPGRGMVDAYVGVDSVTWMWANPGGTVSYSIASPAGLQQGVLQ